MVKDIGAGPNNTDPRDLHQLQWSAPLFRQQHALAKRWHSGRHRTDNGHRLRDRPPRRRRLRSLFRREPTPTGNELWKTDGTVAGTVMVKDIDPGPGSGSRLTSSDRTASCSLWRTEPTHGAELWKTDGTTARDSPGEGHQSRQWSLVSLVLRRRRHEWHALLHSLGRNVRHRALAKRRHGSRHTTGRGHQPG